MSTPRRPPPLPQRTLKIDSSRPAARPYEDDEPTIVQRPPDPRSPAIEVVVVQQSGTSYADTRQEWVAVEIWTKNRVYMMNRQMYCIEVADRVTGKSDRTHALLGAQLTGGQRRSQERVELSQPLPFPGMKAVFCYTQKASPKNRFGETSKVERVVLRLGLNTIGSARGVGDWEDVSAKFFAPGW